MSSSRVCSAVHQFILLNTVKGLIAHAWILHACCRRVAKAQDIPQGTEHFILHVRRRGSVISSRRPERSDQSTVGCIDTLVLISYPVQSPSSSHCVFGWWANTA